MALEISCDFQFALAHIIAVWQLLSRIQPTDKLLVGLVHANEQATITELLLITFIDVVSRQVVDLIYHEVPTTKIEIADTEIHTFHTYIRDNVLQALCEFSFNVVVNPGHSCDNVLASTHVIGKFIGFSTSGLQTWK